MAKRPTPRKSARPKKSRALAKPAPIPLRQARSLLGWSQSKLADRSGLNVSAINDIESGRSKLPSYEFVMAIVGALKRGGLRGLDVQAVFPVNGRSTRAAAAEARV